MARRKRKPRAAQLAPDVAMAADFGISVPQASSSTERFLSPNEIGKIMNVSGEAVKQWIFHRRLSAVKLNNGYWKVRVSDFEIFLKSRTEVSKRRVLITDSCEGSMSEVIDSVMELDCAPVVALNLTDAMLKSLDHFPALFIINLDIKEVDPWRLAEKIRTTKGLSKFPILLVSNSAMADSDAERALKLSVQGFLKLPEENAVITAEIERILNR